ncbi:MAG: nitrilase-related carbon-nitrogen hydrolase, partial [Planctomycetota bacterium]
GRDPHLNYVGGTIAVDPMGEVIGELGNEPGVLSVEIDPDAVRTWRKTFPAWRDMKLLAREG